MSRYRKLVSTEAAKKVFGDIDTESKVVIVAHGYDTPCCAYFCDLEPDCEIGIYYGLVGLTRQLDRWKYRDAMKLLGLRNAVEAVELDIPY